MKNKKKIIIICIIIVIILLSIILKVVSSLNKEEELDYEIGKIEKQTLMNSISSSGTISTEESKNVTSVLVGNKVTDVKVKVGDKVNVGDTLLTFDVDTLRKTAGDLASSINSTKEQTNISVNGANRAVQDAENARNKAKEGVDDAKKAYDDTLNNYNNTINQLNTARTQIASFGSIEDQYKNAQADVATKNASYEKAKADYEADKLTGGLNSQNLENLKNQAEANLTVSKANLSALEPTYQQYVALNGQISKLEATVAVLRSAVDQAKSGYDQAQKAYDSNSSNLDNAILSAKDGVASAQLGASTSTLTLEEQLESVNKQLEDANLKSTVSGTVTAVNIKNGDTYQGGTLLTIEGVESFIVEVNIDEYDIADIKEGMDVIIKTDATRDEELQGKVIFVAPSSNASSSSSSSATGAGMYSMTGYSTVATGSGASYLVKIEVLTSNDRLRLGMSAKANIILDKAEDALVVPYDAINEKEDGTKTITVINDDNSQTEIEVQVGLESGYYSEIKSDKIKEGMKIVLPKVDDSTTVDELLDSMGATGGIE